MSQPADTKQESVTKVRRLTDVRVEADVEGLLGQFWGFFGNRTTEDRAKALEEAVREFNDFIRDHRSMDRVRLSVERTVQEQCSACEAEWEVQDDDGVLSCASCGRPVEVTPP